MCGIVGAVSTQPVSLDLYDALISLQHRGQDAAGIATCDGEKLNRRKSDGLVRDVFRQEHMDMLQGNFGIGHVRYPTAGISSAAEAQPLYVNSPFGICLAHNGNITNSEELKTQLFASDLRHINTTSDSEILLNVFASELQKAMVQGKNSQTEGIFKAVTRVHDLVEGAYAVVLTIIGYGIVAFRDPNGIRPLCMGKRKTSSGIDYMIASESVALTTLGFELTRDILPGEAVCILESGDIYTRQCAEFPKYTPCIFEQVYLARPDSILDGVSVYKARLKMGDRLADKILRLHPDHDIDVVIPIPDTSCTSASPLAYRLNVKYREGLVKNRYIGRTFIMPEQQVRMKSVKQKLSPIELEFKDKNVLLVDDSIIRGTTSKQIVQMARNAGAKKVYLASAAPPVRYPNVYGIDMPSTSEFVAQWGSEEEIAKYLNVDWLIYQDLEDLLACVLGYNDRIQSYDCSVFNGFYVTGTIDEATLSTLEENRGR